MFYIQQTIKSLTWLSYIVIKWYGDYGCIFMMILISLYLHYVNNQKNHRAITDNRKHILHCLLYTSMTVFGFVYIAAPCIRFVLTLL